MSNLFTKRHFEWMVDMCLELELNDSQVLQLSNMLLTTNPNYNRDKFVRTVGINKGESIKWVNINERML